jgi:hypothetical protein
VNVGDVVGLLAETLTDQGNVLDPRTAPKGTIVGFRGMTDVVVSWHTHPPQTSRLPNGDVVDLTRARRPRVLP